MGRLHNKAQDRICAKCGKRTRNVGDELCAACAYQQHYSWMLDQDADDQDWEFATCEECGSSLDSNGDCRNTNCGASPHVGEDWE